MKEIYLFFVGFCPLCLLVRVCACARVRVCAFVRVCACERVLVACVRVSLWFVAAASKIWPKKLCKLRLYLTLLCVVTSWWVFKDLQNVKCSTGFC